MSLSELSTELDGLIIQQLPQYALHALTLTNKYYRGLAEPYLYRNIKVHDTSKYSMARLALNLVVRKELARYIRSFELVYTRENRVRARASDIVRMVKANVKANHLETEIFDDRLGNVRENFLTRSPEVKKIIQDLAGPLCGPQFTLKRFTGQFLGFLLTIILLLAPNLEHLQLEDIDDEIPHEAFWGRWQGSTQRASGKSYPFHKLKSLELSIGAEASIPILPPTESLKIRGQGDSRLCWLPHNGPRAIGGMCSLELQDVQISQDDFETMISLPQMRSMKHLKMTRIGHPTLETYDYRRLIQLLSTSLLTLKTLEWIGENGVYLHGTRSPFGSFRGLMQLEELTLDYQYLTPWTAVAISLHIIYPEHIIHPEAFFPASLKVLRIKNIPSHVLMSLQRKSANYILGTAKYLGLSRFDLYTDLPWSSIGIGWMEAIRKFLAKLVSSLDDIGTSMRIYNHIDQDDSELLCEKGYVLTCSRRTCM
ncbi:hypothetical protein AALT_g11118 [Alternaria alternata]|nr:hypothetical protein AALT_g11118 [Alternaria alternata]